ncbi:GH1 family beta-glucosidase [Salinimonas chungwhensis]|uniref:GH1 family beta-glucosidase n=1 Tax=Salinimonas chungwhensis TaxID=265425 RepID=UPI00036BE8A4|nr:GH1 family beta-glucosidase [Salinimonas chungwhensis]
MKLVVPEGSVFKSPDFTVGVATSSFQIEGAAESREASIWDTFCQQPGAIADNSDGTVACDHINRWHEDLSLIASLNVDAYRFSVSWPRIMRADGSVNQQGIDFYIGILDFLHAHNIRAYVTLYHWDLPQYLEDRGGWLNRETAYEFARYTEVVTKAFGDRVYSYATLNEPFCSAYLGYEIGVHAPGKAERAYGKKAIHHLLLAHGLAMPVIRRLAPSAQAGIVLNFTPYYPASAADADAAATALAHAHHTDWYIQPLLTAQYPALLDDLPEIERPDILPGDMQIISAANDYLGVNYYTRARVCYDQTHGFRRLEAPSNSPTSAMGWEVFPQGLTDLLIRLHEDYVLPPVLITENGMACDDTLIDGKVADYQRIAYLQAHMDAVNNAAVAGVNITGYFVWSLLDNFEWALGYTKRFGIVYVDYDSQQRFLKQSAIALQAMLAERCIYTAVQEE